MPSLLNDNAIVSLVGALRHEQNDGSAVQRACYMALDTIALMGDDPINSLPAAASLDKKARAGHHGDD